MCITHPQVSLTVVSLAKKEEDIYTHISIQHI